MSPSHSLVAELRTILTGPVVVEAKGGKLPVLRDALKEYGQTIADAIVAAMPKVLKDRVDPASSSFGTSMASVSGKGYTKSDLAASWSVFVEFEPTPFPNMRIFLSFQEVGMNDATQKFVLAWDDDPNKAVATAAKWFDR